MVKNRQCQINIMQAIWGLESASLKVALVSKLGTEVRGRKVFTPSPAEAWRSSMSKNILLATWNEADTA